MYKYTVEPWLYWVKVGKRNTDKWNTPLIETCYQTNYEKMYNVICILSVYNVIFLMTIFDKAIENVKNTLNSIEQIRQNLKFPSCISYNVIG
jgi:hypothetical protein